MFCHKVFAPSRRHKKETWVAVLLRSAMSSAGDSGDRLNQFKNKGKDVNVSSDGRRRARVVDHCLLTFSYPPGVTAQEGGSQRGAAKSQEGWPDLEEKERPVPRGGAFFSPPGAGLQRPGRVHQAGWGLLLRFSVWNLEMTINIARTSDQLVRQSNFEFRNWT